MRHFLLLGPVAALAFGMGMTASATRLIAAAGSPHGGASCLIGTGAGTVAVTAITVAANDDRLAATRTQVASSGEVHGQKRANGGRQQRPLREILCMQRYPSGWRGAASELAWRLGPMSRRHLQRLSAFTALATEGLPPRPVRASQTLPHLVCQTAVCFANRPPGALRAAGQNHYR